MVVQGGFCVALVEANSRKEYKEHVTPDGKEVYVEVEQDAE
jgi:hypothetical protein